MCSGVSQQWLYSLEDIFFVIFTLFMKAHVYVNVANTCYSAHVWKSILSYHGFKELNSICQARLV